jgi:DNA-binding CsgD family transcriptional regulator
VAPTSLDRLAERETQVLRLVAEGCANAEIADLLVIAESTAKTHVKRILAKVGARDRAQAVVIAYQRPDAPLDVSTVRPDGPIAGHPSSPPGATAPRPRQQPSPPAARRRLPAEPPAAAVRAVVDELAGRRTLGVQNLQDDDRLQPGTTAQVALPDVVSGTAEAENPADAARRDAVHDDLPVCHVIADVTRARSAGRAYRS